MNEFNDGFGALPYGFRAASKEEVNQIEGGDIVGAINSFFQAVGKVAKVIGDEITYQLTLAAGELPFIPGHRL
jgi:hypothetical protein